mgnify:CR=1 FL=1
MVRTIVSIDVGTTKICTLVGEVSEKGDLRIVGVGVVPSRGLRKGVVVNASQVTEAIAASVEKAEHISGYKIQSAFVGVSGGHISGINSRGVVAITRKDRGICQEDVERTLEAARAIAIPHDKQIIHTIPRRFTVDGQDGVRDPVGLQAFRLEAEAHIVTGSSSSIANLVRCVQGAGVEIDDLVLAPLAAGEAVLTESEREMGVVLADMGGGTTDIAIFIEGSIWHTIVLSTGGIHLTSDVAIGLRMPFTAAEEVKIRYGHALSSAIHPEESLEIIAFGGNGRQAVSRQALCEILEARAEEILTLILQEIKRSGYDGLLPAGVVLCGGAARLAGLKELGQEILGLPVRVGAPHDLEGLVDILHSPAYATSVGLLLWGMREGQARLHREHKNGFRGELIRWLRAFLPG